MVVVNVLREGIALHMIPKEKEDGNYEGRKKSDRKTLAATAFAEELKNVPESFFFML